MDNSHRSFLQAVKDKLVVRKYTDRKEMGEEAARSLSSRLGKLLEEQDEVNIIFAAAPSQNECLDFLAKSPLEWTRVNAFHMDEYLGIGPENPGSFANFLKKKILDKIPFKAIHYLDGRANDPLKACAEYSGLLDRHAPDIVCLGIGENGHIAFNDPHNADFADPVQVKTVTLGEASRIQQVHDGCFSSLEVVPRQAITLTIPALMRAKCLYCLVPGRTKAWAVFHTLFSPIRPECPASILRTHPHARLFLDKDSASRLPRHFFKGPEFGKNS
jgi:glucosamine-6-phosphate deaminase